MTTRKTILLGFTSAAWVLALQGASAAQQCKTTTDCPKGSSCQELTVTTVASGGGAVDAGVPVCPKDQPNCSGGAGGGSGMSSPTKPAPATPTPTTTTTTTTTTELYCQPIACKVDADCGSGMVCFAQTGTACSGSASSQPACPPNQVCPPAPDPAPPVCTTTTSSYCAFKWQLPCQVDADCGDNSFSCQPSVSVTCSGGASTGSGGTMRSGGGTASSGSGTVSSGVITSTGTGGAGASTPASKPTSGENPAVIAVPPSPPDTTPPVCTTTTSLPGYCQIKNSTCTTDADCPADWTCVSVPDATPISVGAPASASSGPAVAVAPVPTPGPATGTTASKVCTSPASFGFKGVPGVSGSGTGSASSAPGTMQSGSTGTGNAGTGTGNGSTAGGNTPTTPPAASGPVRSDSGATTGTATGASAPKSSGGCAVGGGARDDRGSLGLGLGVLGLALVVGRRRRVR